MPAKDLFHQAVCTALKKDGWIITHDPLSFKFEKRQFYIDLGVEKLIAAEKGKEKVALEIKSFVGHSSSNDFYGALGQFLHYKIALESYEPDRILYLAVPLFSWDDFFQHPFTQRVVKQTNLKIMVYDTQTQVIKQWIK